MYRLLPLFFLLSAAKEGPLKVRKLPSPRYISPMTRGVIDERMEKHGETAMRLSLSVVLLEYGDVWDAAQGIVEQPGIARPRMGAEDAINAELPSLFFDLQDQLRVRAKDLQKAAKRKESTELSSAYGRLTETCVSCHAVYLNGPGSEAAKKAAVKALVEP